MPPRTLARPSRWVKVILSLDDSTAARLRHKGSDRITCLIFLARLTNSMAKQLFGTDGIRGVPGEAPLDDATLDRVGLALGEYVSSHARLPGTRPRVLIGRDTRESGPHITERIARGLAAAGAEAVSAGVLTTPGVAWLVHHEGFAAGVVISASHNPYHDNGVKLISSTGMKFPDAVEAELERTILASSALPESRGALQLHDNEKIDDDYLDGLRAAALPGAQFSAMKIVMDCANGAASKLGPALVPFDGRRRDRHQRHSQRAQHQCRLRFAASRSDARARDKVGRGARRGI